MMARADLLKHLIPEAEIILVLRDSDEQLESAYRWAVANETAYSRWQYQTRAGMIAWWLNPNGIVKIWRDRFKVVHVLDFKDFKRNPEQFGNAVYDILGVPHVPFDTAKENASLKGWRFQAARLVNWAKVKIVGTALMDGH